MPNLALKTVVDTLGEQRWLDSFSDKLQNLVNGFYKSSSVSKELKNLMNGVWLGHPLHPVITDLPIGAWTAALILDSVEMLGDDDSLAPGADALIGLGLVGAVGAALTGLTDWSDTYEAPRRIGLTHALLNITATVLYAKSYLDRKAGHRLAGQATALMGMMVATAAAYLGGELVYEEQIGVDHTKGQQAPQDFTPVLAVDALSEGQMRRVEANDARVLLVRQNGQIYALCEVCAHQGGPLAEGELKDGSVVCPWHGSEYALEDGRVIYGPSTYPQPVYETRIHNGQIEIRNTERKA